MTTVAITWRHNWRHDAADRIEFAMLEQTIWRAGLSVRVPFQIFRLALCMTVAGANGRNLSTDELVDVLFAEDINGGPDQANRNVAVYLSRIRKLFAHLGMKVVKERNSFYRISIEPMLEAIAA
jgi:hypothetical protein